MGLNSTPCIWCYDPSVDGQLCRPCKDMNEGPRFNCVTHGNTMGSTCSWCEYEQNRAKTRIEKLKEENTPLLNSLLDLRKKAIKQVINPTSDTRGLRFMDALHGMSIDAAIDSLAHIFGQSELDAMKVSAYKEVCQGRDK